MHLSDPVNIMLDCCIPDKKKLIGALSTLSPGETLRVEIDNCVASRTMVETFLKNKWCGIVKIDDLEDRCILHIRMHVDV